MEQQKGTQAEPTEPKVTQKVERVFQN